MTSPQPYGSRPPRNGTRTMLLVLAGVCWLLFALSLLPLLFVWIAVSGNDDGTGLAWPLTGVAGLLLIVAIVVSRAVDRAPPR